MEPRERRIYGQGGILGGGGSSGPSVAPNTLYSESYAITVEVVSEGPILGLAGIVENPVDGQVYVWSGSTVETNSNGIIFGGVPTIFFNGVPLFQPNGQPNFVDTSNGTTVNYVLRYGLPDQPWVPGLSDTETEENVGQPVTFEFALEFPTFNPQVDAIRLTIGLPELFKEDSKGDVSDYNIDFALNYKNIADPGWTSFPGPSGGGGFGGGGVVNNSILGDLLGPGGGAPPPFNGVFTIYGKTTTTYEQDYYVQLRQPGDTRTGPWYLQVIRLDADPDNVISFNPLTWVSYAEIIEARLIYPDTAYLALQMPALAFNGTVPLRTFELYGRIIRVPSNYTPATRTYTGIWDGTFQQAWTDNPAWCMLDMLTHPRYGLGLSDEQVDIPTLYTIAQYCDEFVPDPSSSTGTQPRYTMNVCINAQEDAYSLISKMAASFNAMPYYSSGGVSFAQDSPRNTDIVVNHTNVEGGMFEYQQASYRDTPNQIFFNWNDPTQQDQQAIEGFGDDEDIGERGQVAKTFDGFGVRDQGLAHRMARWMLYSGFNNGDVVSYVAGLDHSDAVPGWVVQINDPLQDGVRFGGRLVSAVGNVVTLDSSVTLDSGVVYTLYLMHPDKTVNEYAVSTGAGVTSTLTLGASPPANMAGQVWGLSASTGTPALFRVISKVPKTESSYQITALRYDPDKYALIESNLSIQEETFFESLNTAIPPPTNVVAKEFITTLPNGTVAPAITIGWSAAPDAKVAFYNVMTSDSGQPFQMQGQTRGLTFELDNTPTGNFQVQVQASTYIGTSSTWSKSPVYNLLGLGQTPPDVTNFNITILGANATLTWDPSTALNVASYEVRFSPATSGAAWQSSPPLQTGITATSVVVPYQPGTYFIKAVTFTGTYSVNAAEIISTMVGFAPPNIVITLSEEPGWSGTNVNTAVNVAEGTLSLNARSVMADWPTLAAINPISFSNLGFARPGTYTAAGYFDLGAVFTVRLTPAVIAVGDNILDTMASWLTLAAESSLSGTTNSDWSVVAQFRFTNDNPGGSPTWTPWQNAVVGDYVFRAFERQIVLNSDQDNLTPVVSTFDTTLVMPDRIISANNVNITAAGLTVAFNPAYLVFKGVGIAIKGLPPNGFYKMSAESVAGFTIQAFEQAVNVALSTTGGSATATVPSAVGLSIGMYVLSANVPLGVTITNIVGTTLTLSSGTGVVGGTDNTAQFARDAVGAGYVVTFNYVSTGYGSIS